MMTRVFAVVIATALLGACSAKKESFISRGIGKGDPDAEHVTEPNAMAKGPGLFTGKSGSWEIYSEDEEDAGDPNKPRRVKRRRR